MFDYLRDFLYHIIIIKIRKLCAFGLFVQHFCGEQDKSANFAVENLVRK